METKKETRSLVLKRRRALSQEETEEKSRDICKSVIEHPWFGEADIILLYMDYNHEVMTGQMIEAAWSMGKCVGLPKVHGDHMEYYRVDSYEQLIPGTFGIMEPKEGLLRLEIAKDDNETKTKVLAVMPGVAFDRKLDRIGYGGGYYDRYYEKRTKIRKIAVAFELQLVPFIEAEQFDLRPDLLVTEKQLYCPD